MAAARAQARRIGNDYSRGVAQEMQARVRASRPSLAARADSRLRGMLGVTDDAGEIARLRGLRGTVNRGAASLMVAWSVSERWGQLLKFMVPSTQAIQFFPNVSRARDPIRVLRKHASCINKHATIWLDLGRKACWQVFPMPRRRLVP